MGSLPRHQRLSNFFARKKRISTVMIYGASNILPTITTTILAIIYTQAFSLQEFGIYGILSSIISFVGIILDLGIPSAALRNYYDQHEDSEKSRRYMSSLLYSSRILSILMVLPIAGILYLFWARLSIGDSHRLVLIGVLLSVCLADRSAELLGAFCRGTERPGYFGAGRASQGIVTLTAACGLVWFLKLGVPGALAAVAIGRSAAATTYYLLLKRHFGLKPAGFDWGNIKDCLAFGIPLVPTQLARWGRQLALRPFLAYFVPISDVGLFSLASSVAALPNMVSTAVDLALAPLYFKQRSATKGANSEKYRKFSVIYSTILLPFWIVSVVFIPEILNFVAPRYAGAAPVSVILLCAGYMRAQISFPMRQVQFLRKTWVLPLVTIPFATISIFSTVILAPTFGILAAGWSVLAADILQFAMLSLAIRQFERTHYTALLPLILLAFIVTPAIWISCGTPALPGVSVLGAKVIIVTAATLCSALMLWPDRRFIHQLMKR